MKFFYETTNFLSDFVNKLQVFPGLRHWKSAMKNGRSFGLWYFKALRALSSAGPLMAVRETFISLLPFYIVSSLVEFGVSAANPSTTNPFWMAVNLGVASLHECLTQFFPLVVALTLGATLAKYKNIDALQGGALSAFCLHLIVFILRQKYGGDFALKMAALFGIFMPFLVVYVLCFVQNYTPRTLQDVGLSPLLTKSINVIVPAAITVAVVHVTLLLIAQGFASLRGRENLLLELPLVLQGAIRMFVANLLWSFGLHGENLFNLVVGREMLQETVVRDFTLASLLNTFVLFGGAGGTLSLLLAMALRGRISAIGKISAPFQFFNINEIMVYGHPVVFNPYLILPFVLYPVIGFGVSYAVVSMGWVTVAHNVQWLVPVGLSAYVAGEGHASTLIFQAAMLLLGAVIYLPFLRLEQQDSMVHKLEKLFSEEARPQLDIANAAEMRYAIIYKKRLTIYSEAMQAIDLLSAGRMCLWYQPKIDVLTSRVSGFEALLRVELRSGKIVGPAFVEKLEAAGYSDALNAWVVQEAVRNLRTWKEQGFAPEVSLNVTADFLANEDSVASIIERVGGFAAQVKLEMLESSFAHDFQKTQFNVSELSRAGIRLSIDDFGSGYSNLALLNKLDIEAIKIDRSLLLDVSSERGRVLYRELCSMIRQLDYELVAEGVETEADAVFVQSCGVKVIQGWLYSKALPLNKAMAYAELHGMVGRPPRVALVA